MLQIAIDGPAASGKSTVAKRLADRYQLLYLDTGAMYRAITLACLLNKINPNDPHRLQELLRACRIDFDQEEEGQRVLVNGHDVTDQIRTSEVDQAVSEVSAQALVRQEMVKQQQAIARQADVVMDGRDIGTKVLPQADLKFYLVASSRVRAQRRFAENQSKGLTDLTLDQIEEEIKARDHYDQNRDHSPLVKAADAIEIDTSDLSIDQVVEVMSQAIDRLRS
ncbi:(d)CMP kinase [Facklamia languida]|uniref:Cytidylate kinase n=1 Tax=Facklamia languida CCUG 37842 TaxID=883113 RepID=H3NGL5_9LACT|nr:(d)CMP kinase [Facklamia languida]EHR38294.1 cytidylate kinase [Facklamia languida CCUG 37842]